jgi:hypothetical protein
MESSFRCLDGLGRVYRGIAYSSPAESYRLSGTLPVLVTAIIAAALVAAYSIWTMGIHLNNQRDREISYIFRKRMCAMVQVQDSEIDKILDKYSKFPTRRSNKTNRTNFSQRSGIAVTIILAAGAVLAMYARTHAAELPKTEQTIAAPSMR